ncbi:MAG: LysE family transporter [Hyphomicrobiales bacterium]|nr:LysE family transporter [Hyphomicrobiales bacterium]
METAVFPAAAWTLAVLFLGPTLFLVARYGILGRRRDALAAVLGASTGMAAWGMAWPFGASALFAARPDLLIAHLLVGVFVLALIGLRLLRRAWRGAMDGGASSPAPPATWAPAYIDGLIINLTDPRPAHITAAAVTMLSVGDQAASPEFVGLFGLVAAVAAFALFAVVLSTATVSRLFRSRSWSWGVDGVAGLGLMATAIRLLLVAD